MDSLVSQLADQLLLIERELHVLGWWSAQSPSAEDLSSQQPFCVDTLAFEQWLQWIFLPRMKDIVEQGKPLPAVSGIREMGEFVYMNKPEQTRVLLELLGNFDRLISNPTV